MFLSTKITKAKIINVFYQIAVFINKIVFLSTFLSRQTHFYQGFYQGKIINSQNYQQFTRQEFQFYQRFYQIYFYQGENYQFHFYQITAHYPQLRHGVSDYEH